MPLRRQPRPRSGSLTTSPGLYLRMYPLAVGCLLAAETKPPEPDTSGWSIGLEDSIGNPLSGFADDRYAHGRWFYGDGRYGIEVTKQDWLMWSTHATTFTDFALLGWGCSLPRPPAPSSG